MAKCVSSVSIIYRARAGKARSARAVLAGARMEVTVGALTCVRAVCGFGYEGDLAASGPGGYSPRVGRAHIRSGWGRVVDCMGVRAGEWGKARTETAALTPS